MCITSPILGTTAIEAPRGSDPFSPISISEWSSGYASQPRRACSAYNDCDTREEVNVESEASPCVLVYDVGGSHISSALCYSESYRLSPVVKTNLPDTQTSEAFVDVLY